MLEFINAENESCAEFLARKINPTEPCAVLDDICEVLEGARSMAEMGCEVKLAECHGTLVVLVYDGEEYSFFAPIPLTDGIDGCAVYSSIADFAVRELIPLKICDVPREELEVISSVFPHVDGECYEDDDDLFALTVHTELDLLDAVPSVASGEITLDALRDSDAQDYFALVCDREVNKFWGYDFRQDFPDADGALLLKEARSEYERGVALSLAIRLEGVFVGEAVLHGFDLRGGALSAIRLTSECRGRGVGPRVLEMLISLCRDMGLRTLRAEVDERNVPSVKMCRRYFDELPSRDGIARFEMTL